MNKINLFIQGSRKNGRRGEGKIGNYWTSLPDWPKFKPTKYYLSNNNELIDENSFSKKIFLPSFLRNSIFTQHLGFIYDPKKPLLTTGGNNLVLIFLGFGCGSEDQSKNENRDDVISFTSSILKEPLAIVGHLKATLHVTTSNPDTDFFVSITDVHPTGESMQIRYGLQRMKYRKSTQFETIVSDTTKGEIYKVQIDLWNTGYIVAAGHQLRVSISSAYTPYYAKNDNSGELNSQDPFGFKDEEISTNVVHFSKELPSYIDLPIVSLMDIPKNENF